MQNLKAVITWCVCPVLTAVTTMQELSMPQLARFNICMKPIHFGGKSLEMFEVHMSGQATARLHPVFRVTGNTLLPPEPWLKWVHVNRKAPKGSGIV